MLTIYKLEVGDVVEIMNSIGQQVFQTKTLHTQLVINTDNLPAGVYILNINGQAIQKVVK